MCRREIPAGYLENPSLLQPLAAPASSKASIDASSEELSTQYQWFYEGRNGWWEYDERTTAELEEAYKDALKAMSSGEAEQETTGSPSSQGNDTGNNTNNCELLIAGFLYVIDFENMIQYRRNEPQRRRRVKRDARDQIANMKGIAGLRLNSPPTSQNTTIQGDHNTNSVSNASAVSAHSQTSHAIQDDDVAVLSTRIGGIQLISGTSAPPLPTRNPGRLQVINPPQIPSSTASLIDSDVTLSRISPNTSNQTRNLGNVRALNQHVVQPHVFINPHQGASRGISNSRNNDTEEPELRHRRNPGYLNDSDEEERE